MPEFEQGQLWFVGADKAVIKIVDVVQVHAVGKVVMFQYEDEPWGGLWLPYAEVRDHFRHHMELVGVVMCSYCGKEPAVDDGMCGQCRYTLSGGGA